MGTTLEIAVHASLVEGATAGGAGAIHEILSRAFELGHQLEAQLSRFRADGALARLNAAEVGEVSVRTTSEVNVRTAGEGAFVATSDAGLMNLLQTGVELERRFPRSFRLAPGCSHGAPPLQFYDLPRTFSFRKVCRCPIDLGGIAKGAVVDRVYAQLQQALNRLGIEATVVVNAGGDLRSGGESAVEIRVPSRSAGERRYNLQLSGSAVATSTHQGQNLQIGDASASYLPSFQHESHAASVSVVAATCLLADAFTKVAFQYDLGRELSARQAEELGLQAVLCFDDEGNLISATEW